MNQLNCPNCGEGIKTEDRFCGECGAKLPAVTETLSEKSERVCPRCGTPAPPGNRFCGNCGAELSKNGGSESVDVRTPSTAAAQPTTFSKLKTRRVKHIWWWLPLVIIIENPLTVNINVEVGIIGNFFVIAPLATCILAFLRPIYWVYAGGVTLLLQIIILGEIIIIIHEFPPFWIYLIPLVNAVIVSIIAYLRKKKM